MERGVLHLLQLQVKVPEEAKCGCGGMSKPRITERIKSAESRIVFRVFPEIVRKRALWPTGSMQTNNHLVTCSILPPRDNL